MRLKNLLPLVLPILANCQMEETTSSPKDVQANYGDKEDSNTTLTSNELTVKGVHGLEKDDAIVLKIPDDLATLEKRGVTPIVSFSLRRGNDIDVQLESTVNSTLVIQDEKLFMIEEDLFVHSSLLRQIGKIQLDSETNPGSVILCEGVSKAEICDLDFNIDFDRQVFTYDVTFKKSHAIYRRYLFSPGFTIGSDRGGFSHSSVLRIEEGSLAQRSGMDFGGLATSIDSVNGYAFGFGSQGAYNRDLIERAIEANPVLRIQYSRWHPPKFGVAVPEAVEGSWALKIPQ